MNKKAQTRVLEELGIPVWDTHYGLRPDGEQDFIPILEDAGYVHVISLGRFIHIFSNNVYNIVLETESIETLKVYENPEV